MRAIAANLVLIVLATPAAIFAATPATATMPQSAPASAPSGIVIQLPDGPSVEQPSGARSAVQWIVLATVLSIAPAVMVMATCFTRVIVVLGLLRAALATPQLPPNQVLFGLALLMTVVVMAPTYSQVHRDAVGPYMEGKMSQAQALSAAEGHAREFMIKQVDSADNAQDVLLFLSPEQASAAKTWRDVPTWSLLPGYVVSELKVAFMIGFRIFLPFLVIDMLVAGVLVSMGMLMVPPALVSLPFKLLLFVLADGWHLVIGTLMTSLR